MKGSVIIIVFLFVLTLSCKKQSIADYISYDKDTINNPIANPSAPKPFVVADLYGKTWQGFHSSDQTVSYVFVFNSSNTVQVSSSKGATNTSEAAQWFFNAPNTMVLYPNTLINNENIRGTHTIVGNKTVIYLSRNGKVIELRPI